MLARRRVGMGGQVRIGFGSDLGVIERERAVEVRTDHIREDLCGHVFEHLRSRLSVENFMDRHDPD